MSDDGYGGGGDYDYDQSGYVLHFYPLLFLHLTLLLGLAKRHLYVYCMTEASMRQIQTILS